MSPVHIRARIVKDGKRYDVRYRLGGRGFKIHHAGTFRTHAEARARRDLIAGELAAGRDPRTLLEQLRNPPAPRTIGAVYDAFIASRVDVSAKTTAQYRNARASLGQLADRDPSETTPADWQGWIAANAHLAPGTLSQYLSTHRQVLDFADVEPNPARSRKVKLPAAAGLEPVPPSRAEWDAIKAHLRARSLLILRLMECDGLRVAEAVDLEYGDVDFTAGQLRISRARSKGGTAGRRWIPVPPELLDAIDALCPLEDRHRARKVFAGLNDQLVRQDLARACRDAGIPHFHPHDLRHRRISLWIAHGFDVVTVSTWSGHSKASMSTDVYGHVIVPGEDEWRRFWIDAYTRERLQKVAESGAREAPVTHEEGS